MIIKKILAALAASLVAGLIGLGGYEMSVAQDAEATPEAQGKPEAADMPEEDPSDEAAGAMHQMEDDCVF